MSGRGTWIGPGLAPSVRSVEQHTGTVASLRCQCVELERERDAAHADATRLALELIAQTDRNNALAGQVACLLAENERLRNELATARAATSVGRAL